MRKMLYVLTSLMVLSLTAALPALAARDLDQRFVAAPAGTDAVPGRYLVLLEEAAVGSAPGLEAARGVRELTEDLARAFTFRVERTWSDALTGFVAEMSEDEARHLARHPFVALVEQDYGVQGISAMAPSCYAATSTHPTNTRALPTPVFGVWKQTLSCKYPSSNCIDNWGLDRIDQRYSPQDGKYTSTLPGTGVFIFVFDTGIADNREFLNLAGASRVARSLGQNFSTSGSSTNTIDYLGHGTHVAGLAAGRTYGVAKIASMVPIKVCNNSGYCYASGLISGFNHATALKNAYPGEDAVGTLSANHSSWKNDTLLVAAVNNMIAAGAQLVQSAGNQGASACTYSFGNVSDTIVVGGTDSSDARYDYTSSNESNYGSCVDLFAPAQEIVSASRVYNRYCSLTGTSMAAPHVAGALALYLEQHPGSTPAQLRSWLISDATTGVLSNVGSGSPNRLLYVPW